MAPRTAVPSKTRNLRKRSTVAAVLLAITASGVTATWAANRESGFRYMPDQQLVLWDEKPYTTTDTQWGAIKSIGPGTSIAARGPMTLTLSATFSGAPVDVRIRVDSRYLQPRPVRFNPGRRALTSSYTFAGAGFKSGCHYYDVQWRSPTGRKISVRDMTTVMSYQWGKATAPCF
jgi:hypothetical protein